MFVYSPPSVPVLPPVFVLSTALQGDDWLVWRAARHRWLSFASHLQLVVTVWGGGEWKKSLMFSQTVCRVCAFERDHTWGGCPLYLCASHFPCRCGGNTGWLGVECVGPSLWTLPSGISPALFNWLHQIYERPLQTPSAGRFYCGFKWYLQKWFILKWGSLEK